MPPHAGRPTVEARHINLEIDKRNAHPAGPVQVCECTILAQSQNRHILRTPQPNQPEGADPVRQSPPRQTTAPHTRRRRPGPGIPHHAPAASRATGSRIPPPAITCRRPADQQSIGRSIRRRPSGATCSGRGHHTHRDGGTRSSSRTPQPQNGGPTTADRKHAQQSAAPRSGTTCPPMTTSAPPPGRTHHRADREASTPASQKRRAASTPGPAWDLAGRGTRPQPESWRAAGVMALRQRRDGEAAVQRAAALLS